MTVIMYDLSNETKTKRGIGNTCTTKTAIEAFAQV